jgi:hypothetical protein
MKRILIPVFILVTVLMMFGCKKKEESQQTTVIPTLPTPATVSISVNFGISETGYNVVPPTKNTDAVVIVDYIDGSTAKILQDATVTINGTNIPYDPTTGAYSLIYNKAITAGSTVALSVVSSHGNFSASGALPVAGGTQVQVAIPGTLVGIMYIDHFK